MMWRLVIPLICGTLLAWAILYGMPKPWRGRVWEQMEKFLTVGSAVGAGLFVLFMITQFI